MKNDLQKKLKGFVRKKKVRSIYICKGQGKRPAKKVKKVL